MIPGERYIPLPEHAAKRAEFAELAERKLNTLRHVAADNRSWVIEREVDALLHWRSHLT